MIENMTTELTMLGTGNATVTKCYNTCFTIKTGNDILLVDAGGGNGILGQLEKAGIAISEIHDMFVTHAHTDHILGAVWMVRIVMQKMLSGQYTGTFRVYGHDKVLEVLDGETFEAGGLCLQCFDIASTKEKQFGFRTQLPDGQSFVCLGDEPYNVINRSYVENADWLLCEAFCLYEDREVFQPYKKHHSTALDAGRLAAELGVKNLVLYHTEDRNLDTRKQSYMREAAQAFSGTVYVPDDLERINI